MNVSAVSAMSQRSQDFSELQSNLQAGNITGAQRAFAAFQQDVQKTAQVGGPSSLFAPGTQASKDLQNLGNALRSANITGAQQAFASLQQDIHNTAGQPLKSLAGAGSHHPFTPAQIANNGVPVLNAAQSSTAAQAVASILNLKA